MAFDLSEGSLNGHASIVDDEGTDIDNGWVKVDSSTMIATAYLQGPEKALAEGVTDGSIKATAYTFTGLEANADVTFANKNKNNLGYTVDGEKTGVSIATDDTQEKDFE